MGGVNPSPGRGRKLPLSNLVALRRPSSPRVLRSGYSFIVAKNIVRRTKDIPSARHEGLASKHFLSEGSVGGGDFV
jgi:hypothetical protein